MAINGRVPGKRHFQQLFSYLPAGNRSIKRCCYNLFSYTGIFIGSLLAPVLQAEEPGIEDPVPIAAYLNGVFPAQIPGASADALWTTQDSFPNLTFVEPVRLLEHPTENKIVVVSKDGQIALVDDNPGASATELLLDLRGKLDTVSWGEGGLTGLAFHPEFGDPGSANRGFIYVWYRWSPSPGIKGNGADGYNRLSRFHVSDGAVSADINSEFVLLQQFDRQQFHIGGDMFFGDDGYLYIALGDEGGCCDRTISTQRLDFGLWSGVIRIDVDQDSTRSHPIIRQPQDPENPPAGWPTSFTQGYYIPNDNPFVDPGGANLEEFFAIGLRHPWTMSRDEETGNIWTADVGEAQREEVNLIVKGGNYQWGYMEGTIAGVIAKPATIIGTEYPPLWEYTHAVGQVIIGAGVYRGNRHPGLVGKYLFYDFEGGQLWTLELIDGGAPLVTEIAQLPDSSTEGFNSFLLTQDGRILMAKTAGGLDPGGTIHELVPQGAPTPQPPDLLSQTGAFQNLATLEVTGGCIPYDLNVPFQSDNAIKTRWMCIPNDSVHDTQGEQIGFSEVGEWQFPVGAVLIKHFEMGLSDIDPGIIKRQETRFVVHAVDGYYGVTYRWRPGEADADLLFDGEDEILTIETATGSRMQTWHYPSRNECMRCHNSNAGRVLGPNTRQLNRDLLYPGTGITANQLFTLNHLGIFSPSIDEADIPGYLTATPSDDPSAGVFARARSYLDSNCAYCHRPGGVRANFDARLSTPLVDQNIVHGSLNESLGIDGAAVIVPGSLSQSVMYLRANETSEYGGMPPLAKNLVDTDGVALLAEWIQVLPGFTIGNSAAGNADFLDAHNPGLFVNEGDTYINTEGQPVDLTVSEFTFLADRIGNPVTPCVVKVNADNDFVAKAIGSTRTTSEYFIGSNTFPFDDAGERVITVQPGEKIATCFMDSFPDGSGWGAGNPVPAATGTGEDELWMLTPDPLILASDGFIPGRDTPAIAEGESPLSTNSGKALKVFTNLLRSYQFGIGFTYGFDGDGGPGPGGGTEVTLGNDATVDGSKLDSWLSNMVINETDTYTNTSGTVEQVSVDRFAFYARRVADPVTPFVVRVNGDNDFTVLAIGTTRTGYSVGTNDVAFSDSGAALLDLNPGQTLATGFLDANADGSGGGLGAVIPRDKGGDEIWRTGGSSGTNSGSGAVVVGSAPIPGNNVVTNRYRDYHYQISLAINSGTTEVVLGNDATVDGSKLDGWLSNLVVNETDTYTNGSAQAQQVSIEQFSFYARQVADPVTPFVVRVNADNDFTVLAVGTTRSSYSSGPNSFPFSDGGAVDITLNAGETLATGFLDANADGSGGGLGAVIPRDKGGDEIWRTGGSSGSNSGSGAVVVGSAPIPGNNVVTNRYRDYHYQISLAINGGGGTASISNGSFELDPIGGSRLVTSTLTDWLVTTGNVELLDSSVFLPPAGNQSLDLNGDQTGSIEQVVTGLNPNSLYTLYVSYADQSGAPELATADIYVNTARVGEFRTTVNAPDFITCNGYEFTSSSNGTAIVEVVSTVAGDNGGVIDNVYIMPGGLPLPPESPAVVNGSFETPIIGDPHLCADQLPGWRVTHENVDVVGSNRWPPFDGEFSLDLNGHGPGGIAQTVTGLTPGQSYTFSFAYARHRFWSDAGPLTADVIVNGEVVAQLTTTTANIPPNWLTMSIPVVAPANGKITLGFRSTALESGGGVVFDDVQLSP